MHPAVAFGDNDLNGVADYLHLGEPNSAVAALFQDRILPSASPEMIASIADSITERNFASDSRSAMRTLETVPGARSGQVPRVLERFEDKVVARQYPLDPGLCVVWRSHEDHGDIPCLLVGFQLIEKLKRIGVLEMGIQQYEVGSESLDVLQSNSAAAYPLTV